MISRITPLALRDRLAAGEPTLLVDVREDAERAHCRIGDGPHIPLGELHHRAAELDVPEGVLVVVYCHHGVRSLTGAAILQQHGIAGAASLQGGIDQWSALVDPRVPRY
jgi:rhodanese-related sulfurtransferase